MHGKRHPPGLKAKALHAKAVSFISYKMGQLHSEGDIR
jgi:hypothetical protein